MKAGKAVGAIVPWILIIIGLAVMYQVAQRSGLLGAAGGIAGAVSGGGRPAADRRDGTRPGGLGEVLGAVVSGPNSGDATGGGKGISGVNASPVVNAVPVSSGGSIAAVIGPRVDLAPGPQTVTVPAAVIGGPITGMPVGAMVIEHTDARVNKGLPQLISLANGMSASEFGRRLAQ